MKPIGYTICVFGSTQRQAEDLLRELVCENDEQIDQYNSRNRARMSDGTTLVAVSAARFRQGFDGYRFDEVFFDGAVDLCSEQNSVFRRLDLCCAYSDVPPEFRWWPLANAEPDRYSIDYDEGWE